jgi:predicted O-methyltransferase YrrM
VDARLGDAHELVKTLPGPWDFVFQDADKDWYLQYFLDLDPKMAPGGCYTAHNVTRPTARGVREFLARVRSDPRYETRFAEGASGEGISVSCRKRG